MDKNWLCCDKEKCGGVFVALLSILIIAVTVYIVILSFSVVNKDKVADENRITISAQGKVTAVPDLATINLSVKTQGKAPKEVQDKTSEAMNKIIDFVKSKGVDPEDIKTLNLSITPRYYYPYQYPRIPCPLASEIYPPSDVEIPCPPSSAVIIGYEASQTLYVKIREIDKAGEIVDGAVKNGATQVSGINFSIDDPDEYKAQARELAFKKAREKAESLAKIAGMKIKKVVTFSENEGYFPAFRTMETFALGAAKDDLAIETPIEAGSQEVTVNVSVTFEIK